MKSPTFHGFSHEITSFPGFSHGFPMESPVSHGFPGGFPRWSTSHASQALHELLGRQLQIEGLAEHPRRVVQGAAEAGASKPDMVISIG